MKKEIPHKMKTAQIGKCGELLVQYKLLLLCIESAPLTTDSGIDLVAYSPQNKIPVTIQVKTNLRAKRGGGKGKEALDWWVPEDNPAKCVALVDLSTERVWLLSQVDISKLSQQKSNGRYHFYMYIDPKVTPRSGRLAHSYDFEKYLLQNCAHKFFS